jgi:dCMP deaminase
MIIGLTGSLAAGKGVVADFLKKKGFVYLSLSDELRQIAKENKIELTRQNLQDLGNKLRREQGTGILAKVVIDKIYNQEYKKAVVDGIRNPAEVEELRKVKDFFLVSVDAPQEIRFHRMTARNRESDPMTYEDFLRVDARDKGEGEEAYGQGVGKCMALANFTIQNSGTLEEVGLKIEEMYDQMEGMVPRPTWDEYFMEISRAVAKRATCNRGRSGCVISRDKQILVTGYVGSPKGLPHCDEVGHQFQEVVHPDGTKRMHCVRTTHAEQNAICQAAKLGIPINGATLYCKMTPCAVCAKLIINSGIVRVVCEKKYHAGVESEKMFETAGVQLDILNDEVEKYKHM